MAAVEQRVGEIVARAIDGDTEATATLYRLYNRRLTGIAHHRLGHTLQGLLESVDLVQSVWRDVLQALDQFEDRGPDSFFKWLHTCLIHKLHAKRRFYGAEKRNQARSTTLPDEDLLPTTDRTPSQQVATTEQVERLLKVLERLPSAHREIVLLRLRDGLTYPEIAERVEKSAEAVKKVYQRGLDRVIPLLPE